MKSNSKDSSTLRQNTFPNLAECTIEFRRVSKKKSILRTIENLFTWPKRFLKKIHNTYLLVHYKEFREPVKQNLCPMRMFSKFQFLTRNLITAQHSSVIKAIFEHPRKDPNGIWDEKRDAEVFLSLARDLFPDQKVDYDDTLFTCTKEMSNFYRQPILHFLGPSHIGQIDQELDKIIHDVVDVWEKDGVENLDAAEFCFGYTTNVLSKLLLGHPGPMKVYNQIADANTTINKYAVKRELRQNFSEEEKLNYAKSLQVIRDAIDLSLTGKEKPALGSFVDLLREGKKLTELQIKTTLFSLFFAGTETASSVLTYMLWQLGQGKDYQEEIYQELKKIEGTLAEKNKNCLALERFLKESIRIFTPAYILGREPAADLVCEVKDKTGKVIYSEEIESDEGILCGITFAARDPLEFENPDVFNPMRFKDTSKPLSWSPFGHGKHFCPGQWLAKDEIGMFVAALIEKYTITSRPKGEFKQVGFMTLQNADTIWIDLKPRTGDLASAPPTKR